MQRLTNDQKAQIYNNLLFKYQRVQEQIRLIRAESIDVSPENEKRIAILEQEAKRIFNETKRLYN